LLGIYLPSVPDREQVGPFINCAVIHGLVPVDRVPR
jgi:hypothetical protein